MGSWKVGRRLRGVETKMHFCCCSATATPSTWAGHSASCRRDQCCHAGSQLFSTCSSAAATAASCRWMDQQLLLGPSSLDLGGLPSGARSPMAVGSVHHCRCLPWIGAWTGKGLEGGPAAGPAACRPALWPLLPILGEPAQSWSNLRDSQSVAGMADPPTARDPQQQAPPQLSPLSGAYLLIVVGEPFSEEHKKLILQKLQQGKGARRGWDSPHRAERGLQITNRPGLGTMQRGGGTAT